jgi:hypothetical protein
MTPTPRDIADSHCLHSLLTTMAMCTLPNIVFFLNFLSTLRLYVYFYIYRVQKGAHGRKRNEILHSPICHIYSGCHNDQAHFMDLAFYPNANWMRFTPGIRGQYYLLDVKW